MAHPFSLFKPIFSPRREVLVTPEITSALEAGAAVAIGVSGGKDSAVTALATIDYPKNLGHRGPRVLIQVTLGGLNGASHCRHATDSPAGSGWN